MTTTEEETGLQTRASSPRAPRPAKEKRKAGRGGREERAAVSRPAEEETGLAGDATASSAPRPAKRAKPARQPKETLALGPEPRVDLMPRSIRAQRKRSKIARRLGLALVGVIVLTVAGVAGSTYVNVTAQVELAKEQAQTQSILQQQQKYMPVRKVQDQVALVKAAQQVGASTEVDWKSYLSKVQATLPGGVAITTVKVDSASPLAAYAQASAPLQGSRVATLTFAATTSTLPQVPAWLNALGTLPGYVDGGVTVTGNSDGTYLANVTIHVNDAAFDKRFEPKKGK